MAPSKQITINDIATGMQNEEMRRMVQLLIPRTIRTGDYEALRIVSSALPDSSHRLKLALFYLETAEWDLHDACFMIEVDTMDREDSWIIECNAGMPGTLQKVNIELNRALAKVGENFDEDMFDIYYRTGPNSHWLVSFPEAARARFDKNDQDAVDDLNRWRRGTMWHLVGPEQGLSHSQGGKWHPLHETYVHNRFAMHHNDVASFREVFEDYGAVFNDVFVPGRAVPTPPRSQSSITSWLHREVIGKHEGHKASTAYLTNKLRIAAAKAQIREQWKQRQAEADQGEGEPIYPQQ